MPAAGLRAAEQRTRQGDAVADEPCVSFDRLEQLPGALRIAELEQHEAMRQARAQRDGMRVAELRLGQARRLGEQRRGLLETRRARANPTPIVVSSSTRVACRQIGAHRAARAPAQQIDRGRLRLPPRSTSAASKIDSTKCFTASARAACFAGAPGLLACRARLPQRDAAAAARSQQHGGLRRRRRAARPGSPRAMPGSSLCRCTNCATRGTAPNRAAPAPAAPCRWRARSAAKRCDRLRSARPAPSSASSARSCRGRRPALRASAAACAARRAAASVSALPAAADRPSTIACSSCAADCTLQPVRPLAGAAARTARRRASTRRSRWSAARR